jgi:surface protein
MVLPIDSTIAINVTNNTSLSQNVNILGGTSDPNAVPPFSLYQWDLTNESYFGSVTATIVISNASNPTPITYSVQVNGYNIQSVVFALNSLNLGVFQLSGNIIYVSNDYYIYGELTVLSNAFISEWDTTNTAGGSSSSNQIKLPLNVGGTYNFTVYWGDGSSDLITSWNQAETLHTYAISGLYTIGIIGVINEWSFGNSVVSDAEKILSISSWGVLQFGTVVSANFLKCSNLDLLKVTDVPDLSNTITLSASFSKCTSLNIINKANSWDTSNVVDMSFTFSDSFLFNQDIGLWNTINVTDMESMFENAFAFNKNIGSWNISSVNNFVNFMSNKTNLDYSSANLNSIYNGWSLLTVQPNLTIDFGTIKYTLAGQAGRNILTSAPNNWTINDGGI